MLSAKIDACQIPGLAGFSFELKNGHYDASETSNPTGITFPKGLEGAVKEGENWKGIWFSDAIIKAPKEWGLAGDKDRTTINLKNFIKDKVGVSIRGEATGFIDLDEGNLEGFAVSVDKISLDIIRNQFKSIKMEGRLALPILPPNKALLYEGIIDKDLIAKEKNDKSKDQNNKNNSLSMSFAIKPNPKGYDIDWLKAHLEFDKTTQFIIKNDAKEKGFIGTMSGVLSIKTSEKDTTSIALPGLKFEGMEISKMTPKTEGKTKENSDSEKKSFKFRSPKFSLVGIPGYLPGKATSEEEGKYAKGGKVNGFSIKLTALSFGRQDQAQTISNGSELALTIGAKVMLVGESKDGKESGFSISGAGNITLTSKVKFDDSIKTAAPLQKLAFGNPKINKIKLAVKTEVKTMKLEGQVELILGNDPIYGSGAAGSLKVETPITAVELKARFGTKDGYNYWCAFGTLGRVGNHGSKPINPLYPTAKTANPGLIQLWGFRGGVYYNMMDKLKESEDPEVTLSRYIPQKSVFGLTAGVTISLDKEKMGSKDKEVFWATPDLGIEISDGVKITLEGSGYMLKKDMNPNGEEIDGIEFKLINTEARPTAFNIKKDYWDLHANMDVFVNIENGLMQGGYDGSKMVEASLKISQDENYIKLGTPLKPGKAKFTIPGTKISITPSAYLMAGYNTYLPEAVLNPFISGMFKSTNKGYSGSVSDASLSTRVKSKVGFAFGAKLDVSLNLRAAILYADFRAMAGFDLSLKSQDINCVGSGKKGLDGWYAEGQVYAGFEGDMGLYIDIFFYEGKISLLTLKAAMLINGGLPNPVYANGQASMKYEVLGGLVSGSTSFKVNIGEPCKPIDEDDLGLDDQFIAAMYPGDKTKNISVFAKPMVSFNGQMGTEETTINDKDQIYIVEIPETTTRTNADGKVEVVKSPNASQVRTFRVRIESFRLLDPENKPVEGKGKLYDNIEYGFKISEMLEAEADYSFEIVLRADEYNIKTKKWIPFIKAGDPWELKKSHSFTTGKKPDEITNDNVAFSYPLNYQTRYLQESNTSKKGFVQFNVPVDYLFVTKTDSLWTSKIEVQFYESNDNSQDIMNKSNTSRIIYSTPVRSAFNVTEPIYGQSNDKTNTKMGYFVEFSIPEELPNSKVFHIKFVRSYYKNTEFTKDTLESVNNSKYNATFNINGKDYSNYPPQKPLDKVLYHMRFGTSKYNTWQEKLNSNPGSGKSTFVKSSTSSIEKYEHTLDEDFTDYEKYGQTPSVSSNKRYRRPLEVSLYNESDGGIVNLLKSFFYYEDEFVTRYKRVWKDVYKFDLKNLRVDNGKYYNKYKYDWGYHGSPYGCLTLIWEEKYKGNAHELKLYPLSPGEYISSTYWGAQYKAKILLDLFATTVNVRLKDVKRGRDETFFEKFAHERRDPLINDKKWLKIFGQGTILKMVKKEGSEYKFTNISKPMDTNLYFRYYVPKINSTRNSIEYYAVGNGEIVKFLAK